MNRYQKVVEAASKIAKILENLEKDTSCVVTGIELRCDECMGANDKKYIEIDITNQPGIGYSYE